MRGLLRCFPRISSSIFEVCSIFGEEELRERIIEREKKRYMKRIHRKDDNRERMRKEETEGGK